MNVLILNGSHRQNGNCKNFCETASIMLSKKHNVSIYNLIEANIQPCNGCLGCEDGLECPLHDDYSNSIMESIKKAELIVYATPTYFNMPSAAMINLIDRSNNLCEYLSETPKKVLVYISGQTDEESMTDTYNCLKTYFEIMGMQEISKPLLHVARFKEPLTDEMINILNEI